jgi:hypothetical protein
MIGNDYIPHSDDSLNTWLLTFANKLGIYGITLGMLGPAVTAMQGECIALSTSILGVETERNTLRNTVNAKDTLRTSTLTDVRKLAKNLKTNAGYTDAIGEDMGIIGGESTFDPSTEKPVLKTTLNGGQATVHFNRAHSNGAKLYSKRGGETVFTFLALDTHAPYHDTRDNITPGTPETRQYYAFYIDIHDAQYGLQSDIVSVTL